MAEALLKILRKVSTYDSYGPSNELQEIRHLTILMGKNYLSTLQSIDLLLHVYIVIKNETTPRLIQHMLHILFTDSIMSFRAKNKTQFIYKNR